MDLRVENRAGACRPRRTFHTPAGDLRDVIQWARPNVGYGDGPNPHRVEPLVKSQADLPALSFLYPQPRRMCWRTSRWRCKRIGDRGLLIATDCTHAGCWAMEALGPEGMLLASVSDPELLRAVCRLGQDQHLRNLRAMLEQGLPAAWCNWFQCGPSVGWSPATFQEFFLPLIRE